MSEGRWRGAAAALAAAAIAGCGPGATGSQGAQGSKIEPSPRPTAVATSLPDFAAGPWQERRSERLQVRVPLPDAPSWQIDDRTTPWFVAKHRAASTQLIVRVWREDEPTNRAQCEASARLSRELPDRARSEIVREEPAKAPRGFDTVATVGVVPSAHGEPLIGFVMAFGANVRRCFAYVLVTTAEGPGAEDVVASRLAPMVVISLENVALDDDRAPTLLREPIPQSHGSAADR